MCGKKLLYFATQPKGIVDLSEQSMRIGSDPELAHSIELISPGQHILLGSENAALQEAWLELLESVQSDEGIIKIGPQKKSLLYFSLFFVNFFFFFFFSVETKLNDEFSPLTCNDLARVN